MDIKCSQEEILKASSDCKKMDSAELEKYVKICSQQSTILQFYTTGQLDPNNKWYKSCKEIINENQSRVISKIGLQNKDFDMSSQRQQENSNNNNKKE